MCTNRQILDPNYSPGACNVSCLPLGHQSRWRLAGATGCTLAQNLLAYVWASRTSSSCVSATKLPSVMAFSRWHKQLTDKAGACFSTVADVAWGAKSAADACVATVPAGRPRFWLAPCARHGHSWGRCSQTRNPHSYRSGVERVIWGGGGG